MPKKTSLCVECNIETPHEVYLDGNDDVVMECVICQHPVKFSQKNFKEAVDKHAQENARQVERRKRLNELLE